MEEQVQQKKNPTEFSDLDSSKKYIVTDNVRELHKRRIRQDLGFIKGDKRKQQHFTILPDGGGILLPSDEVTALVLNNPKICPYCSADIAANDDVILCKNCRVHHHLECWQSYEGCTTLGCVYNHYLK